MNTKDVTYHAFVDELEKIAQEGGLEKESGIQHLVGGWKGLRAGLSAVRQAAQSQPLGTGLWQGAKAMFGQPVRQAVGQAMRTGYQSGAGSMRQIGQAAGGGMAGQAAMAGSLYRGAGQSLRPVGQAFQTAARG
jgi:hypothetical protein